MAFDTTLRSLLEVSKCFRMPCMGEYDRNAILLAVRVANLAAAGGADYTGDITALETAAKEWQVLSEEQRDAIKLYIAIQNAIANGATIDQDANALKELAKCYACIGEELRQNLLLFLKAEINTLELPD